MTETEEDAVDECPFFRFDPLVVTVIIGKVEQGVESCTRAGRSRRFSAARKDEDEDSQRKGAA